MALLGILFSIVSYFLVRLLNSVDDRFKANESVHGDHEHRLNKHGRDIAVLKAFQHLPTPAPDSEER